MASNISFAQKFWIFLLLAVGLILFGYGISSSSAALSLSGTDLANTPVTAAYLTNGAMLSILGAVLISLAILFTFSIFHKK